jgi:exopolyphosphatase/guanosine-5'-triphosphate,3'-diphosphate pyrophosphatase
MQNRIALLDLGTNTFHLLIVEIEGQSITELYRERIFVKLAEGGIEKLSAEVYERALQTILKFSAVIKSFEIPREEVKAVGTAALRRASNGDQFIEEVKTKTDISINLISGEEEAILISKGIQMAVGKLIGTSLIMDIGGGSTEFIILENGNIKWAKSFKIGIGVLFNRFYREDPMPNQDINEVKNFLIKECEPLINALSNLTISHLIGASGSFEVVNDFLENKTSFAHHRKIKSTQFYPIYKMMMEANLEERLAFEKLPNSRAEMIGMAMILMDFALRISKAPEILISDYALKEGLIAEKLNVF